MDISMGTWWDTIICYYRQNRHHWSLWLLRSLSPATFPTVIIYPLHSWGDLECNYHNHFQQRVTNVMHTYYVLEIWRIKGIFAYMEFWYSWVDKIIDNPRLWFYMPTECCLVFWKVRDRPVRGHTQRGPGKSLGRWAGVLALCLSLLHV